MHALVLTLAEPPRDRRRGRRRDCRRVGAPTNRSQRASASPVEPRGDAAASYVARRQALAYPSRSVSSVVIWGSLATSGGRLRASLSGGKFQQVLRTPTSVGATSGRFP
eukprot:2057832-Alexandrium_andersonii.AAC.1